jgi:hypothetical protein
MEALGREFEQFENKALQYGFTYVDDRHATGEFFDVYILTGSNKAVVKIGDWMVLDYDDAVRMTHELKRAVDFIRDMNEILKGGE